MVEHLIQIKKRITVNVNVNIENQLNFAQTKMIIFGVLAYVLMSVIKIDWLIFKKLHLQEKSSWWFIIYMWWNYRHARDWVIQFYW